LFIEKAHAIIKKRSEFVASVNTLLAELFARIAGRPERWNLRCHSSLQGDPRQDAQTLARDREIQAGHALYGLHRDDFLFEFAGRQRKALFLQGEFRISLLALKLALNELLVGRAGLRPVIILDDLYSELDASVGERVTEYLQGLTNQIFITTTRIPAGLQLPDARIMEIREGRIV